MEKADKDNFTSLLIAASNGHVAALKMLIKLGANILVTDKNERTALHWAAQENQPEIIKVGETSLKALLVLYTHTCSMFAGSQRTLTMFVGVAALCYQNHTTLVDN